MGLTIGILFIKNIAGLIAGILLGLLGWLFKFIKKPRVLPYLKTAYCVSCAIAFVVAGGAINFSDGVFIAALAFGYVCNRIWGESKPAKELA